MIFEMLWFFRPFSVTTPLCFKRLKEGGEVGEGNQEGGTKSRWAAPCHVESFGLLSASWD